jgi:hypothetical protein
LGLGEARTYRRSPSGTSDTCQPKKVEAAAGENAQARTAPANANLTIDIANSFRLFAP